MRLSCPSCQTEYDVPDAALTGRIRKLRCVSCGNVWEAGPVPLPVPEPAQVVEAAPEPGPTAAELEYLRRPRASAVPSISYDAPETPAPEPRPAFTPPPMSRALEVQRRIDPAEARHQAERESFAALLEASRQPGNLVQDSAGGGARYASGRGTNPWLFSFLILLLAIGLIFAEREHIMAAWPPSIRFFAALGVR